MKKKTTTRGTTRTGATRRKREPRSPRGNPAAAPAVDPIVAPGSPKHFRARVRMYRQGLGDCFLVSLPRPGKKPFQMLIDCGALGRDKDFMTRIVEHIRDTILDGERAGKALIDVVVATHEHRDHLSGFNQARQLFNDDFEFGAVWLGWTENLTKAEIKKLKETRKKAVSQLQMALASPFAKLPHAPFAGVSKLIGFSSDDDETGSGTIAEALDYLKARGKDAGDLQYLEPGAGPLELDGVDGVRVYVLGPPRDPVLLKGSEVTEQMKKDGVVYHLSAAGALGMDALGAALPAAGAAEQELCNPFAPEHRIAPQILDPVSQTRKPNPYFAGIQAFVAEMYENPTQQWRRIDHDWLRGFEQLALDLDSDTNNTSLVLAIEFVKTRQVLLFVGDAQVGNWQSWASVDFKVPGRDGPLPAHDLVSRTAFYKVGHHCSHNGTLRLGGLELMSRDDLVAFIPLDIATARAQGTKGWDMPAAPLMKALCAKAADRVVISDVAQQVKTEATKAGVIATGTYIDYFLV